MQREDAHGSAVPVMTCGSEIREGAALEETDFTFRLSVCICTRNRPEQLARAVESVGRSLRPVHEIIVADDSTSDETRTSVARFGDRIRFVEGPRRGLCANRNTALRNVTGTHVLFIDDDVELGRHFVDEVAAALAACAQSAREQTIVCGLERNHGRLVFPGDQTFLGHQARRYVLGEPLNTIVINATVFPAPLFERLRFDENLVYGSDEVDLATRAVRRGYVIMLVPQAVNDHFPAEANRDYYAPFIEASRLYVTFKRYYSTQQRPLKALAYAIVSPLHLFASRTRRKPLSAPGTTLRAVALATSYLVRLQKNGDAQLFFWTTRYEAKRER